MAYCNRVILGLAWISTVTMAVAPEVAIGADPNRTQADLQPPTRLLAMDVQLASGGILRGTSCSTNGKPLPNVQVVLQQEGRPVREGTTDINGHFEFADVRGGTYEIRVADMVIPISAWAPNTGPPGAKPEVMATPQFVTRGQVHPWAGALTNPWVFAAFLTAAIVIPIAAIHNNRQDRPSSS